jgi:hypothetical protein
LNYGSNWGGTRLPSAGLGRGCHLIRQHKDVVMLRFLTVFIWLMSLTGIIFQVLAVLHEEARDLNI